METYMETLGCRAKEASRAAAKLTTVEKNRGLEFVRAEEYVCEKKSCCQKTRRTWRLQENRGCPKHFRTD